MSHNRKRYLRACRKAEAAFAKGKGYDKWLNLKWKYWHKQYKPMRLWGEPVEHKKAKK